MRRTLLSLGFLLCFGGCQKHVEGVKSPHCEVDPTYAQPYVGNAGCLVTENRKILVVKHRESNRWDLPGGTLEKGETAQCSAHRETLEETGFRVQVGKLLNGFPNKFRLFACKSLRRPRATNHFQYPVPSSGKDEVLEVRFIDPLSLTPEEWRFPKQLPEIQTIFRSLYESITEEKQ